MNNAAAVAEKLLQIQAVKLSPTAPFTWSSGLKSPIYCDNRVLLSYPAIRNFMVSQLVAQSQQFAPFEVVAGVATAGIPHGALLADRLEKPFIYVRGKAKEHGRQNLIEGEARPGQKVLVVEDLISTGGSSLQAVESLRKEGLDVVGVLAIFSYEFPKADQAFAEAACAYATLSGYSALLEAAKQNAYISLEQMKTLAEWRKDPAAWSEAFLRGYQE
jgi:orotate phosphoribosyltransferase